MAEVHGELQHVVVEGLGVVPVVDMVDDGAQELVLHWARHGVVQQQVDCLVHGRHLLAVVDLRLYGLPCGFQSVAR